MILMDTNVCVAILRGNKTVLANYLCHAGNVAVPFMTVGELHFGAAKSDRPRQNATLVREFLSVVPVLHSTDEIMARFGTLKAELNRTGKPVEDADVLIAATALTMNVPLATGNEKHMSRFHGLEIQNWFSDSSSKQ